MPRLVDHTERRKVIIETTWRIIAEQGIENASMRDIARECGYAAPGILAHYFPNKNALLLAAYELICQRTNERIALSTKAKRGRHALRALCFEIIPAEDLTTVEARVAVSFWQRAQSDHELRRVGRDALTQWHAAIMSCLAEELTDRPEAAFGDPDLVAHELLNTMMGLHITAMLDPETVSGSRQRRLIDFMLERIS
ncbi:TetR family transcriptional regulator [Arthrobacter sp. MYb211]|uniref:TetR/AcrR family transcriptional regulator n=1 Tax=unclassified Arthrobacter TaxID=235627 RepID=UPI000CFD6B2D|nr:MULTISPECIES: TetR/AcrR family transcriptional regulator [unclassified Arthrobacter]PRA12339.1 TetR family transcriptional regulator [Arthrobacter sp. MYb221]PRC08802.1 TetR family transcriptional regulator [Arthrobacter sp. MYb211]